MSLTIVPHESGFVPGPGLYQMPAGTYHRDPCPAPSLSSSVAKLLVECSPEHARLAHPRMGGVLEEADPTRAKELGTAAHKLALGRGGDLTVVEADDYRSAAAKAARADAYELGECPILRPDLKKAEALAGAVLARLADIPGCEGFASAPAEVVAVVQDRSGAWLRVMMDRFEDHGTHAVIWDLKTSEQSAAPHGLGRRIQALAMEVQAALYVRVVETLIPRLAGRVAFRWIFAETEPPRAVSVAEADGAGLTIGARKVAAAIGLWNRCLSSGEWPGYPARIVTAEFPGWAADRWIEREGDPDLAGLSYDVSRSPFRPLDHGAAA